MKKKCFFAVSLVLILFLVNVNNVFAVGEPLGTLEIKSSLKEFITLNYLCGKYNMRIVLSEEFGYQYKQKVPAGEYKIDYAKVIGYTDEEVEYMIEYPKVITVKGNDNQSFEVKLMEQKKEKNTEKVKQKTPSVSNEIKNTVSETASPKIEGETQATKTETKDVKTGESWITKAKNKFTFLVTILGLIGIYIWARSKSKKK
jgi:hypothetical protein